MSNVDSRALVLVAPMLFLFCLVSPLVCVWPRGRGPPGTPTAGGADCGARRFSSLSLTLCFCFHTVIIRAERLSVSPPSAPRPRPARSSSRCYHHYDRVHTHLPVVCHPAPPTSLPPHPPLLRGRSGRVLDMVATTPRMVATEHHLHAIMDGRGGGGGARPWAAWRWS